MILVGLQSGVTILEGLVFLNPTALVFGIIQVYFFVVIYSHYQLLTYDGEQAAYQAHETANSAGYEQFYEPEGYVPQDQPMESDGYQTTQFQGN